MSTTLTAPASGPINPEATTQADGPSSASVSATPKLGPQSLIGGITVPVDQIEPDPNQPRKQFDPDDLDRLARSMKQYGQLVPILVKSTPDPTRYMIVDGEQRWRAAKQTGFPKNLDCKVESRFNFDQDGALERQLITNALRVEIRPVEQATAFRRLMESQGLNQQQLADKLGMRQSDVSRTLSLLGLDPEVQRAVDAGDIAPATAREIAKVDDQDRQRELADRAKEAGLTRKEVAKEARKEKASGRGKAKPKRGSAVTSLGLKKMIQGIIATPKVNALGPRSICDVLAEVIGEIEEAHQGERAEPVETAD